jgi:hypothetical protein
MGYLPDDLYDSRGNLPNNHTATPAPMPERWTTSDQVHLEELQKRRDRVLARQRGPVREIAAKLCKQMGVHDDHDADDLTGYLIEQAEPLIDALKPYDSGTRPAPER